MNNLFNEQKPLVIASRKSDLARLQSLTVGAQIKSIFSNITLKYRFHASLGDINLDKPLWKMPEKGVFTQDFYDDLVNGEVDMVVHSWKDLPVESRPHSEIIATLAREDVRDLLLIHKDAWKNVCKNKSITILSSSPRRIYNLTPFLPEILPTQINDCDFKDVRGNINTRISKLLDGDGEGLIVAKAAIDRLLSVDKLQGKIPHGEFELLSEAKLNLLAQLEQCMWMILPVSINPTAAAQGAIAIEVRNTSSVPTEDKERHMTMISALKKINCSHSFSAAKLEREILSIYGGGCHQKIGINVIDCCNGQISYLNGITETNIPLNEIVFTDFEDKKIWQISNFNSELVLSSSTEGRKICTPIVTNNNIPTGGNQHTSWISTVKEWKDYAKKGVWINGTTDTLLHCADKNSSISISNAI